MTESVQEYLSRIGGIGGSNGTGKNKKRGSKEYYRKLAKRSAKARQKNKSK